MKWHSYIGANMKSKYEQKLTLLPEKSINSGCILEMSNSLGTFGVSVLEETILVQVLGEERALCGHHLATIFTEKCMHAQDDPQGFGYGILHRKKFCEVATFSDVYAYFKEGNLLNSRAWVGITENITGRFLFFDQGKKIDTWIKHCVNSYRSSLKDVIDTFDHTSEESTHQPVVIHLGDFGHDFSN